MEKFNIEPYNNGKNKDYRKEEAYIRAKKRVEKIKGFYGHLLAYVLVNLFLSIGKISSNIKQGAEWSDVFTDFGTYAIWVFWGIGLLAHAFGTFGPDAVFGKEWEQKQIDKYLEKEKTRFE